MTEESIKPFPELVVDINSSIPEIQLKAVSQLGKLLTQKVGNSLGDVIESGVLPTLVSFLGSDKEEALQKEATWALTSITSGGSSETNALVEAGALPLLVNLLSSKNEDIQDNVVVVLGNIAGDSVRLRDLVLESGVVLPLCNCVSNCHKVVILRHMTWALSNLCRGTPPPALAFVLPAIPILDLLLGCPDDEILSDACWALAHISEGTNERIDAVLNERSIVPRLVELLDHVSPSVMTPSLRAIGNIVTGQLYQTQVVLDCPLALPFLKKLTHNPIKSVRKEACWAISNITAGSQEQRSIQKNGKWKMENGKNAGISIFFPFSCTKIFHTNLYGIIEMEKKWKFSGHYRNGKKMEIFFCVQNACKLNEEKRQFYFLLFTLIFQELEFSAFTPSSCLWGKGWGCSFSFCLWGIRILFPKQIMS